MSDINKLLLKYIKNNNIPDIERILDEVSYNKISEKLLNKMIYSDNLYILLLENISDYNDIYKLIDIISIIISGQEDLDELLKIKINKLKIMIDNISLYNKDIYNIVKYFIENGINVIYQFDDYIQKDKWDIGNTLNLYKYLISKNLDNIYLKELAKLIIIKSDFYYGIDNMNDIILLLNNINETLEGDTKMLVDIIINSIHFESLESIEIFDYLYSLNYDMNLPIYDNKTKIYENTIDLLNSSNIPVVLYKEFITKPYIKVTYDIYNKLKNKRVDGDDNKIITIKKLLYILENINIKFNINEYLLILQPLISIINDKKYMNIDNDTFYEYLDNYNIDDIDEDTKIYLKDKYRKIYKDACILLFKILDNIFDIDFKSINIIDFNYLQELIQSLTYNIDTYKYILDNTKYNWYDFYNILLSKSLDDRNTEFIKYLLQYAIDNKKVVEFYQNIINDTNILNSIFDLKDTDINNILLKLLIKYSEVYPYSLKLKDIFNYMRQYNLSIKYIDSLISLSDEYNNDINYYIADDILWLNYVQIIRYLPILIKIFKLPNINITAIQHNVLNSVVNYAIKYKDDILMNKIIDSNGVIILKYMLDKYPEEYYYMHILINKILDIYNNNEDILYKNYKKNLVDKMYYKLGLILAVIPDKNYDHKIALLEAFRKADSYENSDILFSKYLNDFSGLPSDYDNTFNVETMLKLATMAANNINK